MDERELILRIKKIDGILKSRECDALSRYNVGEKVHLKQLEFHKCTKRNRWVFGGNRSGKTECGAVETVWMARGIHPYREHVLEDYYHTRRDSYDNMNEEGLENCIKATVMLISMLDA